MAHPSLARCAVFFAVLCFSALALPAQANVAGVDPSIAMTYADARNITARDFHGALVKVNNPPSDPNNAIPDTSPSLKNMVNNSTYEANNFPIAKNYTDSLLSNFTSMMSQFGGFGKDGLIPTNNNNNNKVSNAATNDSGTPLANNIGATNSGPLLATAIAGGGGSVCPTDKRRVSCDEGNYAAKNPSALSVPTYNQPALKTICNDGSCQ